MKKKYLFLIAIAFAVCCQAQDLATIIQKHEKAVGQETYEKFETVVIRATMEQMGMSMSMTIFEKKPNMLRSETNVNEMDIITVINGDKGYMINPMMGSSAPKPLSEDEVKFSSKSNMVGTSLGELFREGKVELVEETDFDEVSAYKLKLTSVEGIEYTYLGKTNFLILGSEIKQEQMGETITIKTKLKDYKTVHGLMVPHKMITSAQGMSGVLEINSVEVNVPIDDSKFEIK